MGHPRSQITGQRFGRLTVIEFAGMGRDLGRAAPGSTYWRCRCDCGRETVVVGYSITSGDARSCGCLRYAYDATLTPAQQRRLTRELARVAATEGEPARENFRRRAWLYPHLTPALPAEKREVTA